MGKTRRASERAKGTNWREEAQATAAELVSGDAPPAQQERSQDPYALVEFWGKHGQEFGDWWRALTRLEKVSWHALAAVPCLTVHSDA